MSIVLAHELAHTIGLADVYDTDWHVQTYMGCVMQRYNPSIEKEYYNAIKNDSSRAFCDSCRSNLAEMIKTKVHDKNY